jgi:hypothetical protein
MATAVAHRAGPVTRADIESKLRELQGEVEEGKQTAMSYALAVGAVIVVGITLSAFLFGRRRGKKRTTIVEVRRI